MKRMRRWLLLALLAVLLAGGAFALSRHAAPSAPAAIAPAAVTLATARNGDFVQTVAAQGRIGPPAGSSVKLAFAQSGIVQSVDVRVGDDVRAGQPLATLDRAALAATLAAAQADVLGAGAGGDAAAVRSAQARLQLAESKRATLERGGLAALNPRIAADSAARQAALKTEADRATVARDAELFAAGVLAGKDVDAARTQLAADEADQRAAVAKVAAAASDFSATVEAARADVAAARSDVQAARGQSAAVLARRDAARVAYANGVLAAPAGGVVLAVLKHAGEAVDPTVPAIEVGPGVGRTVTLSVPAGVARRVRAGDDVTLTVAGPPPAVVHGTVRTVVPAVDLATHVSTIVVNGAPHAALPGDPVDATIAIGRIHGVLVPAAAVVQDPQSGKNAVFVRSRDLHASDPFAMRTVEVGASDAATAVITHGLAAGDRIAAQGSYVLLAPAGG